MLFRSILTNRSKPELVNQEIGAAGRLVAAGVYPALMTDHPETPIQHLLLCAAVASREGMPREAALRAITLRAAEICRIQDRVGSLSPGKDADFIILSDDPFSLAVKVDLTVIAGRVVHDRSAGR